MPPKLSFMMDMMIAPIVLEPGEYLDWSIKLKTYLKAQDVWDVIESATQEPSDQEAEDHEIAVKTWRKNNAMALYAIQMSCGDSFSLIRDITSAKIAWDTLAERYNKPALQSTADAAKNSSRRSGDRDADLQAFHDAAANGNSTVVMEFIKTKPEIVRARHPYLGETALHVAAKVGRVDIVKELVSNMEMEDLEQENKEGCTALVLAAMNGITKIAECMVEKNKKLVSMASKNNTMYKFLPVEWALNYGQKHMGRYLYSVTPLEELSPEKGTHGASVVIFSIGLECFDIALDLLKCCPQLAISPDNVGYTPILKFSKVQPSMFPSGCWLRFWQQWIYDSIHVQKNALAKSDICILVETLEDNQSKRSNTIESGIKSIYEMKLYHQYSSELLDIFCKEIKALNEYQTHEALVAEALQDAAARGHVEIFVGISKANPTLLLRKVDISGKNAFQLAVQNRQAKIFRLLHGISSKQALVTSSADNFGNSMLHMAGLLAPSDQLNRIPGAALQMQREIQWFKEVEAVTLPYHLRSKNNNGLTARELFTESHKDLMIAGEKWMKDTASSCSLVASLIATIMFAVAFTVPGGNNQDTGFPIFLDRKLFKIFIISDAISLFSSTASVLMFLGILTSRYAEDDFLKSLPTKLIIGLFTLFFSIATMTVAFCAALSFVLHGESRIIIPILLLAGLPVTLFGWMQFPLLIQIFKYTYRSTSIFDKKVKRWL